MYSHPMAATCQQAPACLCAHAALSSVIRYSPGLVVLLGTVCLDPLDFPEKKPQPLICGIVQTGDSRAQAGNLRKQGVLSRGVARFGGQ